MPGYARLRLTLMIAWVLSCVVGWSVRTVILAFSGIEADMATSEVAARFSIYSSIEFLSRCLQGMAFFTIVGVHGLLNVFSDLRRETE